MLHSNAVVARAVDLAAENNCAATALEFRLPNDFFDKNAAGPVDRVVRSRPDDPTNRSDIELAESCVDWT
jgi:hypothetical protein